MAYTNAFAGKSKKPNEREVAAELGASKALWDDLLSKLQNELKLRPEWHSYSVKAGWALRLKSGERNVVYLGPSRGGFRASFVLGGKAVQAALHSGLPARVVKLLKDAKQYAEGTAVRIDAKDPRDVEVVTKLAAIKLEN